MKRSIIALVLATATRLAGAESCADIADDDKRLACYDAAARGAAMPAEAAPAKAPIASEAVAEPSVADAPETNAETEQVAVEAGDDFGIKEYTPDPIREYIEATIVEVRKAGTLEYIRLDNGQVWRELEHSRITFKEGRRVTISEGILNSFDLKMEGQNKIVKVKRIQ